MRKKQPLRLLFALSMKEYRQCGAGSNANAVGDRQEKGYMSRSTAAAVLPAPQKLTVVIGDYGTGDVRKQQRKGSEKDG